jgi:uncharacterized protein YcgL (UPF0745 family)
MNGAKCGEAFASAVFPTQLETLRSFHAGRDPVRMQAYVYKSQRKQDTFVYLARRDDFATMPEPLHAQLAPFTFVLELVLTPERRLALADAQQVRAQLVERGFFLQFPPSPLTTTGRSDD